jgi:hypothetical protein
MVTPTTTMSARRVHPGHPQWRSASLAGVLVLVLGNGCGGGGVNVPGPDAADAMGSRNDVGDTTLALGDGRDAAVANDAGDTPLPPRDGRDAAANDSAPFPTTDAVLPGFDQALDLPQPSVDAPPDVPAVTPELDAATSDDGGSCNGDALLPAPLTTIRGCDYPTCFADAVKDCLPAGALVGRSGASSTVVDSRVTTTTTWAYCYENDVKGLVANSLAKPVGPGSRYNGTIVELWKNAAGLCYSFDGSYAYSTSLEFPRTDDQLTLRTAAGVPVASVTRDVDTGTLTITCPCSLPVTIPGDCNPWWSSVDAGVPGTPCTY